MRGWSCTQLALLARVDSAAELDGFINMSRQLSDDVWRICYWQQKKLRTTAEERARENEPMKLVSLWNRCDSSDSDCDDF